MIALLEQFTLATPGSLIEEKSGGLAWHYRMADPELGERQASALRSELSRELEGLPVELLPGDKVIELRTRGVNKGMIVNRLVAGAEAKPAVLAMGDDQTDEDLFASLPQDAYAVHIGPKPSRAQYRLPDVAAARQFLLSLVEQDAMRHTGKAQRTTQARVADSTLPSRSNESDSSLNSEKPTDPPAKGRDR